MVPLTGFACEQRTVTAADCLMIGERIERAWTRDAMAAGKLSGLEDGAVAGFIAAEADRLSTRWSKRCQALVGQPITGEELECMRRAETIDDIMACDR
ncbi:MAG: hypothetical protein AAGN82_05395 [Myxococcota bacterium]